MNVQDTTPTMADLATQLQEVSSQLAFLVERQRQQAELFEEIMPIVKDMMRVGTQRLQSWEELGYFQFGREMMGVFEAIMRNYSADDVRQLGAQVVGILDTVKSLTQPDVLSVVNDATAPIHNSEQVKPVGLYGMFRASKDDDVRKGFGVALEVLRKLGHSMTKLQQERGQTAGGERPQRSKEEKRAAVRAMLAPKNRPADIVEPRIAAVETTQRTATQRPAPAPAPVSQTTAAPASAPAPARPPASKTPNITMEGFSDEGFLLDPDSWTPELAATIATQLGIPELTEQHWQLLNYARAQFLETGASPNIRKLSKGSGVNTRDIYALFPTAPGQTIAKLAGIPKPGGCI